MDEITLDDKTYVSSKRAAQITGYAKDYVGQLCREGRVEARLVGRNWYVLESSLREHRFGPQEEKKENPIREGDKAISKSAWENPNYVAEESTTFPTFVSKSPEYKEYPVSAASITESNVVQEMQSAWHDWFTRKNEERASEVAKLEQDQAEVPSELISEPEPIEKIEPEELETVRITRVPEQTEQAHEVLADRFEYQAPEEEETVQIHRTYTPPVTVIPPSVRRDVEQIGYRNERTYAPEGRVIRERRIKAKRKPSLALSALFIAIAVIAIAIAAIGSGHFNEFFSQTKLQYAPIKFFMGESMLNK